MKAKKNIYKRKLRRRKRIHKRIRSLSKRLRLCVFRSNRHIYAQIIDDKVHKTLVAASSLEIKDEKSKMTKTEIAKKVGELIAKKATEKGIKEVVFDRGNYKFHGRVKALAEEARKNGLVF
jgi:large subunit ribosomal protein L18